MISRFVLSREFPPGLFSKHDRSRKRGSFLSLPKYLGDPATWTDPDQTVGVGSGGRRWRGFSAACRSSGHSDEWIGGFGLPAARCALCDVGTGLDEHVGEG